jgi:hypothetical protein
MMSRVGQAMSARALGYAYAAILGAVLLLILLVTMLGRTAPPIVRVELPPAQHEKPARPAAKPAALHVRKQPPKLTPLPVLPAITKPVFAGGALIADPALIENSAPGPLPRIADDGRKPMDAYAPPVPAAKGPRIAIVIGGLGVSAKATAAALDQLPAGVTFAFPPYLPDVQHWVSEARARDHEVLMQVPMEPYDYPDSDPGPRTLRSGAIERTNIELLAAALTRFTGYAGITNLLGGRLLSDRGALEPVMNYVSRRGLMFFDSTSGSRSAASDVAAQLNAPFVGSSATIDAVQSPAEIDRRLSQLEAAARESGCAAGTGFVYPVTIARIHDWADGLPGRGFVLVPASAIVSGGK